MLFSYFVSFQIIMTDKDKAKLISSEKRKADQEVEPTKDLKKVSKICFIFIHLFIMNQNFEHKNFKNLDL